MKFNLQLFAYTGNSIVDYLKDKGEDSSFSARKKLAVEYGVVNSENEYTGSQKQNTDLLGILRKGGSKKTETPATSTAPAQSSNASGTKTSNTSTTPTTVKTSAPTPKAYTPTTPAPTPKTIENPSPISGVDKETYDKAYSSTFTPSENVNNASVSMTDAASKYNEHAGKTDIVDSATMDMINTPFKVSGAYTAAMNYTNSLLAQLSSGRTSYTDQLEEIMAKIQNREDFSYDVDSDQLFQQALASAMNKGQTAMQNTIGQASALTGGYGSTYATSAGNQAYNAFIEDAYNNLPEYYQMALNAYKAEGEEMYQQYSMLSDADAKEYQRMYDAWSANFSRTQDMYNREFGTWQANTNNAYNSANLQLQQHEITGNALYNAYGIAKDKYDTLYAQEYQTWADGIAQAQAAVGLMQKDYWDTYTAEYNAWNDTENRNFQDHWNRTNLENENYWNQTTLDNENYWNQKTFDYQVSRDAVADSQWEKSYALEEKYTSAQINKINSSGSGSGGSGGGGGNPKTTTFKLTDTEINKCKDIVANGGTMDDVLIYLSAKDNLPQTEEDMAILNSVLGDGSGGNGDALTTVSTGTVSGFRTTKNDNFDVKVGSDVYRVENHGKVEDADTVKELNKIKANDGDAFLYNGDVYVKYAGGYFEVGATSILGIKTSGHQDLINALR